MTVKINEPQNRGYERSNNHPNSQFYWRVLNYDIYTGHGWATSPTDIQTYQANEPIITESPPYHTVIDQEVNLLDEQDTLTYHTGSLVVADREYEVAWRGGPKDRGDYLGSTISGNSYHLKSIIPLVAESQLRSTVEVYPQWIYDRYLALPEEVPQRVKDLAYEVTSGANSPYDKAFAIEQYLRGFPYTLAVPVPPTEQDIADFFLFDLQKGYCDYYATTMVVMARTTGLPARLVMGYAQGDYDENIEGFVVTEADAHSWVEVYFSEVGWIEFEPTAGLPAIERPERIELLAPVELITFEPPATQFNLPDWLRGLGLIGVLIALASIILIVWMMSDTWRLSRRSPTDVLSSLYRRLYHQAMHLDLPPEPGDTPYEFVSSFSRQVNTKAEGKPWEEWLRPTGPEAHQLINLYVHSFYSAHPPQELHKIQALQIWRRLRHRLWLIRFR
jgi:transglutaminase-like putative cysteine protease